MLFSLLILGLICMVNASYYKVVYETCHELSSTKALFDGLLLPCATYSYNPVELKCLTEDETTTSLKTIPNWTLNKNSTSGDSITRSFTFNDFRYAFLFMSEVAQLAETNQHHPDWRNLYNQVDALLTTDDKACLSTFDIQLAQGMDYLYALAQKAY